MSNLYIYDNNNYVLRIIKGDFEKCERMALEMGYDQPDDFGWAWGPEELIITIETETTVIK